MIKRLKILLIIILKYFVILKNKYAAWRLKNYKTAVTDIQECTTQTNNNNYAIFVYYEPNGKFSKSARNILTELQAQSINTLLICNHPLSIEQDFEISKLVHKIISRGNQGFDFGAYKDGLHYLKDNDIHIDRLFLLNDSIYYFKAGIKEFVGSLNQPIDVVAAFENWEAPHAHHIQSFAMSLSGNVVASNEFTAFWRNYRPVSNRLHAIENGEKLLSKAIFLVTQNLEIVYSTDDLIEEYDDISPQGINRFISFPKKLRNSLDPNKKPKGSEFLHVLGNDLLSEQELKGKSELLKYEVMKSISILPYSPIHSGTYYFARIKCPLVKKDLVYRNVFDFWEVERMYNGCFDDDELAEFFLILRKKGNIYSLSIWQRLMLNVGAL